MHQAIYTLVRVSIFALVLIGLLLMTQTNASAHTHEGCVSGGKVSVQCMNTQTYIPNKNTVRLGAGVELMITATFGLYARQALAVAWCESGYNPYAYNRSSGASGIFQIIPGTWRGTSRAWYSPFNARANVAAAHEIFTRDGHSWREWVCQPW